MEITEIILYLIELSKGKLKGKTLLQKLIYFISVFEKKDFGYSAHYYGPYSTKVESNLSRMISLGFINQDVYYFGEDQNGFDVKGYEYSLSNDGKEILEYYKSQNKSNYVKIEKSFNFMSKFGNISDANSLSIAAKTYHILSEKRIPMSPENIRIEAQKLGWNIKDEKIDSAINFLKGVELVR